MLGWLVSPAFREGDVVLFRGGEHVVADVVFRIEGMTYLVRPATAALPSAGAATFPTADMTLLRRPVRVGDVLRKPANTVASWDTGGGLHRGVGVGEATFTAEVLPSLCRGRWALANIYLDALTHADGTPIEPPKREVTTDTGIDTSAPTGIPIGVTRMRDPAREYGMAYVGSPNGDVLAQQAAMQQDYNSRLNQRAMGMLGANYGHEQQQAMRDRGQNGDLNARIMRRLAEARADAPQGTSDLDVARVEVGVLLTDIALARAKLATLADSVQPKDDEIRSLKARLYDAEREVENLRRKLGGRR